MMIRSPGSFPGLVGAILPGDLVPGAAAVYSLRRWRADYDGPAVRVRRNDNAEQDIGFSGNDFGTAAFSAFVGAGSGFVRTWYDQSGNTHNALQATPGLQPQIVLSVVNGRAVARFDGSDDILQSAPFSSALAQPNTGLVVAKMSVTGVNRYLFDGLSDGRNALLSGSSGNEWALFGGNTAITTGITLDVNWHIFTPLFNIAASSFWVDGAGGPIVGNIGTSSMTGITIGGRFNENRLNGDISELAIYPTALSESDRETIEANQAAYYGITLA